MANDYSSGTAETPEQDTLEGTDVFVTVGPAAIPPLIALVKHRNPDVRETAVALWKIDSDVDTALTVLIRELPKNDDYSKCEWLQVLGEMGARSEAAKSYLVRLLNEEYRDWVLQCVTNALKAINERAAVQPGLD